MKYQKRKKTLVEPRFQLKLVSYFTGLTVLALLFQFVLFASMMSGTAAQLTDGASTLYEEFHDNLVKCLIYSAALILPLTVGVGVLVTFRVAGPVQRFSGFLRAIKAGERPADCTLRKGDELHDLCTLLNEATAPLRAPVADGEQSTTSAAA